VSIVSRDYIHLDLGVYLVIHLSGRVYVRVQQGQENSSILPATDISTVVGYAVEPKNAPCDYQCGDQNLVAI
jgi:hypothetical protein